MGEFGWAWGFVDLLVGWLVCWFVGLFVCCFADLFVEVPPGGILTDLEMVV
jgi:hypothetical protein